MVYVAKVGVIAFLKSVPLSDTSLFTINPPPTPIPPPLPTITQKTTHTPHLDDTVTDSSDNKGKYTKDSVCLDLCLL